MAKKTNEEMVLLQFVRESSKKDEYMSTPWKVGEYAYSCDRYSAARIRVEKVPSVKEHKDGKPLSFPAFDSFKEFRVSELDEFINRGDLVDEMDFSECQTCEATGEVEWTFEHYTKDDNCPNCHGHGGFSRKTGRMVPDQYRCVSIEGILFKMRFLKKLVDIAEFLKIKTIKLGINNEKKWMLSQFGDFDFLFCPTGASEDDKPEVLWHAKM
jgi:hypothetical protein